MNATPIAERIGIIGTGRAARTFALALRRLSRQPLLVWGRDPAKVGALVEICEEHAKAEDIGTLALRCDMLVIAVSDTAIGPVAESLATHPIPNAPFAFHLSGGSGVAVLSSLRAAGARTAAIHPAMTFTGHPQVEVARIKETSFSVTGSDAEATAEAVRIVHALGGRAVALSEAHRPLYHAALCHASNHLVALISGACGALAQAGISDPAAFVAPLAKAALENALDRGMAGLSGPIARGDAATLARHLAALTGEASDLLYAYSAMARATIEALEQEGGSVSDSLRSLFPH